MKLNIDDGFSPELVVNANFDGFLEIPVIKPPKEIIIPERIIPFSKRNRSKDSSEFIHFYEYDENFGQIVKDTKKYLKELKKFKGIITPDFSVYYDSPIYAQIGNIARNRMIGHIFQEHGFYVIPNVRWGDERTYTITEKCKEKFAFLGLLKHSIVSIGTYGCCKTKEEKTHLRNGLLAMLYELEPIVVLVYGAMPDSIFGDLKDRTKFVQYPDWISSVKGGNHNGKR